MRLFLYPLLVIQGEKKCKSVAKALFRALKPLQFQRVFIYRTYCESVEKV